MLQVRGLETFYGASQALFGVDLDLAQGQVVSLLGRNGMGKTTTVRSIMGLSRATRGSILFEGREIRHLPSFAIARLGFGLVPEGRQVFPTLTVRENLLATAANRHRAAEPYNLERIFEIFPRLADRTHHFGNQLSGGEQQMLAVGRALMTNPKVLILDEATEGLAPLVRREIWSGLRILKARGESILVIDKNLKALMAIVDRHYIMEKGCVVWSGDSNELRTDHKLQERYLGV